MKITSLIKFENLQSWLNSNGFPELEKLSTYRVVKGLDFEKEFKKGNVRFTSEGIFLGPEDSDNQVYVFINRPKYHSYGWPKFHVRKCQVIENFIASGEYDKRYVMSNTKTNDLQDLDTAEHYRDVELKICMNCKRMIQDEIYTTTDFSEHYVDSSKIQDVQVNANGYTRNWEVLSGQYRRSKEYSCESCGIKPRHPGHRGFWEVDHRDGNKLNNEFYNLECLCVRCHSRKDDVHIKNYSTGTNKRKVSTFNKLYPEKN